MKYIRNYLLVICFALLVCVLFPACPVYDQRYFEFPLNSLLTNIKIEGSYVPQKGKSAPLLIYYIDDTFDFGYLADTGSVFFKNKETSNRLGKTFYRLYLRTEEVSLLLGRKFDEEPILLKVDAQGKLQFREEIPNLNDGKPYTPIGTVEEFIHIGSGSETRSGSYLLTHELDMLGSSAMLAPRHNWAPIGMDTSLNPPADKFTGIFDGGGKKLWNLYIDRTSGAKYNIGLFGYVERAKLRNIVLGSGSVQGYQNVGGIAGRAEGNSEISGCSNAAGVTATTNNAGGVAGNNGGSITGCFNTGEVRATISASGGIAGYNRGSITGSHTTGAVTTIEYAGGVAGNNGGSITGCSNTGKVTATANRAGGMAGYNNAGVITGCRNTGEVTANTNYAGGIAGYNNNSVITACYNAGRVTASDSYAGGIAAFHTVNSAITACYNTGKVTATGSYAGGVTAYNSSNSAITACYNKGGITANTDYAGGVAGYHDSYGGITACYNTGAITSSGANKGGVLGRLSGITNTTACYWLKLSVPTSDATHGIGSSGSDTYAAPFNGAGSWPDFNAGWSAYKWRQSGDETTPGKYWKSVGLWSEPPQDGSKSEFPKLYWQQ
jgi:hypothetical protein